MHGANRWPPRRAFTMQVSIAKMPSVQFSSIQSLSRVSFFATPWTAALQASLSIANSRSPPKPMSIELMMPSNHLILCHPFLLLPSIFPSIRVFSNQSALHIRWSKYWSFSFNISPSSEHPGLISFRMDWLDLLAVQGILKSLLQHHSSKASILLCSANQSVTTLWDSAFRSHSFQNPLSQSHSLGVWGTTGIWGKDDSLIHGILLFTSWVPLTKASPICPSSRHFYPQLRALQVWALATGRIRWGLRISVRMFHGAGTDQVIRYPSSVCV